MPFFKMLLVFAPWIAFLAIAHDSMLRLKLGVIVAAILTVVMVLTRLHRGAIMWVGIFFFSFAFVAVVLLNNMWTVRNMGILANGALAAGTWIGAAARRPFTLDYAREHTDPSLWNSPAFLRTNYILTAMWGAAFTFNALVALQRKVQPIMPGWGYEAISYGLLILAMFMSTWYPRHMRRLREARGAGIVGRGPNPS